MFISSVCHFQTEHAMMLFIAQSLRLVTASYRMGIVALCLFNLCGGVAGGLAFLRSVCRIRIEHQTVKINVS